MNLHTYFKQIVVLLSVVLLISCDKDFNEIGTDIVGGDNDHYQFTKYTEATVKSYNQKLDAIASNNLPINPLGIFDNPAFGTTTASFVTQLELGTANPIFNNVDPEEYDLLPTVIDSVILEVPYFNRLKSTDSEGKKTYRLDSIYGVSESKFKLSIYQSNFFLRDLDPSQSLVGQQLFYTDNQDIENNKIPVLLNNMPTSNPLNSDGRQNSQFFFDKREHRTTTLDSDDEVVAVRSVPSMRLHLDKTVFSNKILNAPSGQLANNAVFKNYFRGLYFKTESLGNPGNMAMMNFKGGKVTIYYNEDRKTTNSDGVITYTRVDKTLVLNMTGNTVSLQSNSNENTNYQAATSSAAEASKLYLKGGQGSIAVIDIFGTTDLYKYNAALDGSGNQIKDAEGNVLYIKSITPNSVSDELDDLRYANVNSDGSSIYYSKAKTWLINEANLTFYIDKTAMSNVKSVEPNRLLLYDLNNKRVLLDYALDGTTNGTYPKLNKYVHGGNLLNEDGTFVKQIKGETTDEVANKGHKYKIRLTNHIRNLIKNDSTNVRLGLAVTETINNAAFSKLKTANSNTNSAPTMSVLSPVGTILYGSSIDVPEGQRLKLEIYYTKPD
ncbi:MAG TPA: DUF4270 domain-containing protein [Flavobacterium sp.]|nr:DUF4270 domain-containing protein [Flavobacterium sp.]